MATAGKVLGKLKQFNNEYGKPIRDARCRSASSHAIKQGKKANELLQEELKPYLLRRHKMDFLSDELPPKIETCVWVKPSKQQSLMYKEIVDSNASIAKSMMSSDKTVANKARFNAFQVLRKLQSICGHPLRQLKCGSEGDINSALEQTNVGAIVKGSKKIELTIHMLKGFKAEKRKTLLFSQSTQNLDVIQHVLMKQGGFSVARYDG